MLCSFVCSAAALLDPPDGLKRLLQSRRIVIQGLTNTTLNQIGTALAEGLKEGATPAEVADDISYIIGIHMIGNVAINTI